MTTCSVSKIPFKIVGCTSWEEGYHPKCMEDLHPFVKGWRSERYCSYPQQFVIDFKAQTRIRKIQLLSHEFMIASKIEFFIGNSIHDVQQLLKLDNIQYKRLGYVSLSENSGTGYKSREMKTINVDAVGRFLKFVLYSNYLNHLNLCSQISILGLNLLGYKDLEVLNKDQHLIGATGRQPPVHISQMDDLIFHLTLDPVSADSVKKLNEIKQLAIKEDKFELAKLLREAIEEMTKLGQVLCQLEKEKRYCVEQEDYDTAKKWKEEKDNLEHKVHQKLHLKELLQGHIPFTDTVQENVQSHEDNSLPQLKSQTPNNSSIIQERQIPLLSSTKHSFSEYPDPHTEVVVCKPEPLSDAQLNESSIAVQFFGNEIISMIFSKQYQLREQGLHRVLAALKSSDNHNKSEMIKAVCQVLKKGLTDNVLTSFRAAISILNELLGPYMKSHRLHEFEISSVFDKVLPVLMNRLGDANPRVQSLALQTILDMSTDTPYKSLVGQHLLSPLIVSKSKVLNDGVDSVARTVTWRYAKGRLDLLGGFVQIIDLESAQLTLPKIMEFINVCLNHVHSKVRDTAAQLTVSLYRQYNGGIRDLLPVTADDHIAMKNVFWRSLFQQFDDIDGIGREDYDVNKKKMKKLQKLKGQLSVLKNLAMDMSAVEETFRETSNVDQSTADVEVAIDQTCPFCKESRPELKSHMDQHYFVDCPMLLQCKRCSQVVEIKNLTLHYLTDCSEHNNMAECPKCHEVLSKGQLESHTKAARCTVPSENHVKCPLCHANVRNTEESWYTHLTSISSGCAKNPRRKRRRGQQFLPTKKASVTEGATVIPR